MAGFRRHTHPFQLTFERFTAFAGRFFLHGHAGSFLLQPRSVISFPWNTFATIEFKNPTRYIVQKVTVVRNGNYSSCVLLQVMLQPFHRFGIEVVGRFVEQQNIRIAQQQTTQSDAALFTSRKILAQPIFGRTTQRIHRPFQFIVEVPGIGMIQQFLQFALTGNEFIKIGIRLGKLLVDPVIFGYHIHNFLHAFLHYFFYCFRGVEFRILLQISHRISRRKNDFAIEAFFHTGNDFQQSRFT